MELLVPNGRKFTASSGLFPATYLTRWLSTLQNEELRLREQVHGYSPAVQELNMKRRALASFFVQAGDQWSLSKKLFFPIGRKFPGIMANPGEFVSRFKTLDGGQYNRGGALQPQPSLIGKVFGAKIPLESNVPAEARDEVCQKELIRLPGIFTEFLRTYLPGINWKVVPSSDVAPLFVYGTDYDALGAYDFVSFSRFTLSMEVGRSKMTQEVRIVANLPEGAVPYMRILPGLTTHTDRGAYFNGDSIPWVHPHFAYLVAQHGSISDGIARISADPVAAARDAFESGTRPVFSALKKADFPRKLVSPWEEDGQSFCNDPDVIVDMGSILGGWPLVDQLSGTGVEGDVLCTDNMVARYGPEVLKALVEGSETVKPEDLQGLSALAVLSSRERTVPTNPLSRTTVWKYASKGGNTADILNANLVPSKDGQPGVRFSEADRKASGQKFQRYWIYDSTIEPDVDTPVFITDDGYFQGDEEVDASVALAAYMTNAPLSYRRTDVPIEKWAEGVAEGPVSRGGLVPTDYMSEFAESASFYRYGPVLDDWPESARSAYYLMAFSTRRDDLSELIMADIAAGNAQKKTIKVRFEV